MNYGENHTNNFYKARVQGWDLWLNKCFPTGAMSSLIKPKELFDGIRGPFTEINASKFAKVFKCSVALHGSKCNMYFKEYLYRSWWDFIKHLFRPSRAQRAFSAAIMLEQNGLLSPRIIAMGKLSAGPFCVKNFLITSEIENALALYNYIDICNSNHDLKEKRKLINQLGETIGRMHAAGIFHGDLRPGNVFVQKDNNSYRFFLLDNERTKKIGKLPARLRLKNLVQINMFRDELSRTDRMRFFRAYIKQNPAIRQENKKIAIEVMSRTNARLESKICDPPTVPA